MPRLDAILHHLKVSDITANGMHFCYSLLAIERFNKELGIMLGRLTTIPNLNFSAICAVKKKPTIARATN